MTTFRDGRMTSTFLPPTDESGRPLSHAEYIKRKALRVAAGQGVDRALAFLRKYRDNGPTDAPKFVEAMDAAEAAVRALDSGGTSHREGNGE